ncbi:MAG TPA: dephospho-CoA kinase [Vicinamibacterales bacterium]|jgi:dephospho-CoA kinase|nr:dephospho-CoA kinase [Vicinamibacterales bacterium]|tara:strand:- start:39015 stop:39617 length:603 start_codon:yes stop_codon:yes gene_type:complete
MLRIGLTGGLATGKSHVRVRVATLGLPTVDADTIAREVVRPGQPAWRDIRQRFSKGIWKTDGSLNRAALASIIFSDEVARKDLEGILHPRVYSEIRNWLDDLAQARIHRAAVADIPLLYETGHDDDFDKVIVVACDAKTQLQRVMARDGLSKEDAQQRISIQLPTAQKAARADVVISTEGTLKETDAQIDRFVQELDQAI